MDKKFIPLFQEDLRKSVIEGRAVGVVFDLQGARDCSVEFGGGGITTTLAHLLRANNVGAAAAGGFTVGVDVHDPIAALRPFSATLSAGAQVETGLRSDGRWPREDTSPTFGWGSEAFEDSETDGVFGAATATPHRLGGSFVYSMQLEAQTGERFTRWLNQAILAGVGAAIDTAGLVGTGIAGQPLGIFNATGTGSVTFGAAPTVSKVADFEKTIVNLDGVDANLAWIAHGSVRAKWKSTVRFTNGGPGLWTDDEKVLGKRALVTSAVAATDCVLGDWTRMAVLFWGDPGIPVNITVDRISLAKSGKVRLTVNCFADVLFERLNQFCKNADSAVQ